MGSQDRMDSYMYGHPHGRKKRFRSPNELYNHILWLATDTAGDSRNCTCKICSPDDIDEKLLTALQIKTEPPAAVNKTSAGRPNAPTSATATPASAVLSGANQPSAQKPATANQTNTKPQVPASVASASPKTLSNPSQSLAANLPKPSGHTTTPPHDLSRRQSAPRLSSATQSSSEQTQDLDSGIIYRQGELAWFNRGQAWGLGVILKCTKGDGQTKPKFLVQPLSHPYRHPATVTLSGEEYLRPWLAWSVPGMTHAMLNDIGVTYKTADWNAIRSGAYGAGDAEVDGSILAAKGIDSSWSLFGRLEVAKTDSYQGAYLGAERIWTGDLVRVVTDHETNHLMHIKAIFRMHISGKDHLCLSGDVYAPYQVRTSDANNLLPGIDGSTLPPRLRSDLEFRNKYTIPRQGFATIYKFTQTGKLTSRNVLGRWYQTWPLLGILVGQQAKAMAEVAGGVDVNVKLNKRFDCSKSLTAALDRPDALDTETADRIAAFGRAVPSGTKL